jgi:hypothetical protein
LILFLCLVQRSLQKLIAEAAPLLARRDEQLCKKPEVVANPAEPKTDDLTFILRHPETVGVVFQAELLKPGRARRHHRPEAMTLRQVIDAVSDQGIRRLQILQASRPTYRSHRGDLPLAEHDANSD